MTIASFDHLPLEEKRELLHKCCSSGQWVNFMIDLLPYEDLVDVLEDAEQVWYNCDEMAWLEAFSHHPKIGDLSSLESKFASTKELAGEEQSGIKNANDDTLVELAELNRQYESKNGFVFIICATGLSSDEMMEGIKKRLGNDRQSELEIAAEEQNKITKLRLEKLFV